MNFNITFIFIFFSFVSLILVLLGSIQLVKAKSVPGSRLILFAVIGYILAIFLPEVDIESGEESYLILGTEITVDSILMLMASLGFYRLANFVAQNNTRASKDSDS